MFEGHLQRARNLRRKLRPPGSHRGRMERRAPSAQTALDAIPGSWESRLPDPGLRAGHRTIFDDHRVRWAVEQFGGFHDRRILEIGPMEGGASYMAQHAGAREVVAVEANREAFLKCLVVKDLFQLDRVRFLCGDAIPYLDETDERFDVCIALGVLYHMPNPVRLLSLIGRRADRLLLWTHFYEAGAVRARMFTPSEVEHEGERFAAYRHDYGIHAHLPRFLGGTQPYTHWLPRGELMRALDHTGWRDVQTAFEGPHPHGPHLTLIASR